MTFFEWLKNWKRPAAPAEEAASEPPIAADPAGVVVIERRRDRPAGPEISWIEFDLEHMRARYPDLEKRPSSFLAALCELNPTVPREVCAAMGAEILQASAKPKPGQEENFAMAIAWLRAEAQGVRVEDGTPDAEWTKQKAANEWRQ